MRHFVPPRPSLMSGVLSCAGIFAAIATLAYCSFELKVLLALGSLGSSTVLLFCFPESHFSQPRSIVGGHFVSTAVGLAALSLCGQTWWALGAAVALAAAAMMLTRTMHPPAGSNPIIVFLGLADWHFLFFPTLAGAVVLVSVGLAYHRWCRRPYPQYWGFEHEAPASVRGEDSAAA
ncbi:HPP family protein [Pseudoduganella namucuonensis]|uniref:HPP family protein n=1 Tax=Pseudoduganella namucuonensis TaxID=1035707 RepID=UPI000B80D86A